MLLQSSAISLLHQLDLVIDQLSNEEYQKTLPVLQGATIGQHIRHTLEFFLCLMDAEINNQINYDRRRHDKVIETDRQVARNLISSMIDFLNREHADHPLTFKANYEIDQEELLSIPSSFHRELAYNIEHAIHHMALMKIGICSLDSTIRLPDHFGVASSTVRYHAAQRSE